VCERKAWKGEGQQSFEQMVGVVEEGIIIFSTDHPPGGQLRI